MSMDLSHACCNTGRVPVVRKLRDYKQLLCRSMSPSPVSLLLLIIAFGNGICDEHEYRLMKYLLDGYDSGVRLEAENSSQPLVVNFALSLHHIIEVNEENQILTTNCGIRQVWTDHRLKWNASDFAGIKVVHLSYNRIWRPDIILYNNADPQYRSAFINTNVIVDHTGEVVWKSFGTFRSSCDIHVGYIPSDEEHCALKWTYDGYQIVLDGQSELDVSEGDVSNYHANGKFKLLNFTVRRNIPYLTYEIHLRRRRNLVNLVFRVLSLFLPYVVINSIGLLLSTIWRYKNIILIISGLFSVAVFLMTMSMVFSFTEEAMLSISFISCFLILFASGLIGVIGLDMMIRDDVQDTPDTRTKHREIDLSKLARMFVLYFQEKNKSVKRMHEPAKPLPRRKNNRRLHCKPKLSEQYVFSKYVSKDDNDSLDLEKDLEEILPFSEECMRPGTSNI